MEFGCEESDRFRGGSSRGAGSGWMPGLSVALIGVEVEIGDLQIGHDMRTLAGGDDADGAGRGGTVERQLGIGEAPRLAARPQVRR